MDGTIFNSFIVLPLQTIALGAFDGFLVGDIKDSGGLELTMLPIPNLYATRALAWSGDGTKLTVASQTGAVIMLEAVLRYINDTLFTLNKKSG